jgi:PAS domain S-box-containing protein
MGTMQGSQLGEYQETGSRSEFDIFDRNADPALDELTGLAAVLGGADYAYIGWIDFNRLWFKSRHGFLATEQPRSTTPCRWMLETGKPLLLRDAGQDPRFPPEGIPLPGAKPCRSYAGTPLILGGQRVVGTLAILSREPNQFSANHLSLLDIVGRQVVTRIELYSRMRAQEQAQRARQRTERALSIERSFVAATLESIPAPVAVLDTAGRIVRLNYSCTQLTGMSMADAVGRSFVEQVFEADDRAWAAGKLLEATSGQVSGPHETAWRIAGGKGATELTRRVSWTVRPLQGPNGEMQYLIVSGQDVTDQRQAEMALLTSEARHRVMVENSVSPLIEDGRISGVEVAFQDVSERRRLERMKEEFISTVSHELRTPLTSLRASLGLISSGTLDKRPEKQRQMMEMAIGNSDRLIKLVNDIVDFDSFEKGNQPLNREPVEAIDLLRRAADVGHIAATQVHIGFRIEAPSAQVLADEERVLQVLNELVANAIKFSPPETKIRLAAQPSGEGEVCFVVEDQGRGISQEKLERIFDRFQQGDASDSRALGGIGLGLALCRSIVEQHGGRIWAESDVGKGSRFLFTLPAASAIAQ